MNPDHDHHEAHDRRATGQPTSGGATAQPGTARSADELHVCVLCAGQLVHPFNWTAEGPRHWRVLLRCPDCEAVREGLFTQAVVDDLADELDRGSSLLIKALDVLTRDNMAGEIEALIKALDEDLIFPCDF